jgi:hypothetical protein
MTSGIRSDGGDTHTHAHTHNHNHNHAVTHITVGIQAVTSRTQRATTFFFLIHRSHSISFTRAQGIPKYKIGFGREKDGRVGETFPRGMTNKNQPPQPGPTHFSIFLVSASVVEKVSHSTFCHRASADKMLNNQNLTSARETRGGGGGWWCRVTADDAEEGMVTS